MTTRKGQQLALPTRHVQSTKKRRPAPEGQEELLDGDDKPRENWRAEQKRQREKFRAEHAHAVAYDDEEPETLGASFRRMAEAAPRLGPGALARQDAREDEERAGRLRWEEQQRREFASKNAPVASKMSPPGPGPNGPVTSEWSKKYAGRYGKAVALRLSPAELERLAEFRSDIAAALPPRQGHGLSNTGIATFLLRWAMANYPRRGAKKRAA